MNEEYSDLSSACAAGDLRVTKLKIGVLGIGRVGRALAAMLLRRGAKVHVYNRTEARAREFVKAIGGSVAESPTDLVRECDAVCVCLTGWDATRANYLEKGGLLDERRPGQLFIDMGTLNPAQARELSNCVTSKGHHFVYAPVSGRPIDLEGGRGFVMAAGDQTRISDAAAILSGFGAFRYVGGDPGLASVMKLTTNLLAFSTLVATSEALGLAMSAGIDRQRALELLEQGPATSALLTQRRESFLHPDAGPVQGSIEGATKVSKMIAAFADEVDSWVPQAKATTELLEAATAAGFGSRDITGFVDFLQSRTAAKAQIGSQVNAFFGSLSVGAAQ